MKSILFLIPDLGGGGAERVLINMVKNFDKQKYKITVQTIFDMGVNREYLPSDVEYVKGFSKRLKGNSQIFKLFSLKKLYEKIVKKRYDIVVAYLEGVACRIVSGCPYTDSKLVAWIHVEQHTKKGASHCFRTIKEMNTCYNKFSLVACVAETVKKDFESLVELKNPPIVLYNVNETDKIREQAKESLEGFEFSNEVNLISVGRLVYEKGFDRLLNVHKKLLENGVKNHLYILGAGRLEEELKKQAKDLGVLETAHFLGFNKNPYKYVKNADLFVCSSRREGFSTAVTEALVVGTPVVSTNCSGAYELLGENNEYGVVTSQDENELYLAVENVIKNSLKNYKEKAKLRGDYFSKEKSIIAIENAVDSLFICE